MQIGDKVMFIPFVLRYAKDTELKAPSVPGIVVWVHPKGRFAVVERRTGIYAYRECVRCGITKENEVQKRENNSNHEPEGRRGKNGNIPHFGRRAAPRREEFCDR